MDNIGYFIALYSFLPFSGDCFYFLYCHFLVLSLYFLFRIFSESFLLLFPLGYLRFFFLGLQCILIFFYFLHLFLLVFVVFYLAIFSSFLYQKC